MLTLDRLRKEIEPLPLPTSWVPLQVAADRYRMRAGRPEGLRQVWTCSTAMSWRPALGVECCRTAHRLDPLWLDGLCCRVKWVVGDCRHADAISRQAQAVEPQGS